MAELTLESFLKYSRDSLREDTITKESQVIDHTYDGISSYDFLQEIINHFHIDFSDFNYLKYFHTEAECYPSITLSFRYTERKIEPYTFEDLYNFMINQTGYNIDTLTLENLMKYLRNRNFDKDFREDSNIIDRVGDGHEAYYFLKDLEEKFSVDFKKFNFEKYFHRNYELRNHGCLFFWLKKKDRPVEDFTANDLYEYMIKHRR